MKTSRDRATLALHLALPFAATLAFGVAAITQDAPRGGFAPVGDYPQTAYEPRTPSWEPEYAADFPGCDGRPALTEHVVIYTEDGRVLRDTWDHAERVAQTPSDLDDVWVVGWCK